MAGLTSISLTAKILLLSIVIMHKVCESESAALVIKLSQSKLPQTGEIFDKNQDHVRSRREAIGEGPPNFTGRRTSFDDEPPFIPRIDPPPPGKILTYDGKAISTTIGAFSIVPKSERRTPSINRNRPQFATYRGDLPPPIPDFVPSDLPQFTSGKSLVSNFPPRLD